MAVRPNFNTGTRQRSRGSAFSEAILDISVNINERAIREALEGPFTAFGRAAVLGVKETTEDALAAGRASIRSAGFPETWVTALQSRQYPKGKPRALQPKAFINYRFGGVGSVFEFGSRGNPAGGPITPIKGKWLWVPAEGTKKTIYDPGARRPGGGSGMSVRRTAGRAFNLTKNGLVFRIIEGQPALCKRKKGGKYTVKDVQFWGRKEVRIPKKWNVLPKIAAVGAGLGNTIEKNLVKLLERRGGR